MRPMKHAWNEGGGRTCCMLRARRRRQTRSCRDRDGGDGLGGPFSRTQAAREKNGGGGECVGVAGPALRVSLKREGADQDCRGRFRELGLALVVAACQSSAGWRRGAVPSCASGDFPDLEERDHQGMATCWTYVLWV
jgi:hypothetical protein